MTNTQNVQTKKGFTMIELIFVIVIIGILAAVAIPRLAATRDDAKVATCMADVTTLMKDLTSYYTSQGGFGSQADNTVVDLTDITNVEAFNNALTVSGGAAGGLVGAGGSVTYACDNPGVDGAQGTPAVTFTFTRVADAAGNIRVNMNGEAASETQGTVDGDLGVMLRNKNLAAINADGGVDHAVSGIRVRR